MRGYLAFTDNRDNDVTREVAGTNLQAVIEEVLTVLPEEARKEIRQQLGQLIEHPDQVRSQAFHGFHSPLGSVEFRGQHHWLHVKAIEVQP